MTTRQVADRLVELCRTGKVLQAQEELYHDDVVVDEPEDSPGMKHVEGKAAALEKGKYFASIIEEVHNNHISDPIVAGNYFSTAWSMDATMKEQGRQHLEEICVYKVKDGKIIHEEFFF